MTAERRAQTDRIAETRAKLVAAARKAFAAQGYAATSMDGLCAAAGLTRGALYHHFGGKEGMLEAVVVQIDGEIGARLDTLHASIPDPWDAFQGCCLGYLDMALEPEIQRIVLRDAAAVLGQRFRDIDAMSAIDGMARALEGLMVAGRIRRADPEALARLLNGAMIDAALWIAASPEPEDALAQSHAALKAILDGLAATDHQQSL